jgi:hypothetical protein
MPLPEVYQRLHLITPEHANEIIEALADKTQDKELYCWYSKRKEDATKTYPMACLEDTYSRVPGRTHMKIGITVRLDMLALIAKGCKDELTSCSQANSIYGITHLCHDERCIRPVHIVVEEIWMRSAWHVCDNHEIIIVGPDGGFQYNPCPHGGDGRPCCILPRRIFKHPWGQHANGRKNF